MGLEILLHVPPTFLCTLGALASFFGKPQDGDYFFSGVSNVRTRERTVARAWLASAHLGRNMDLQYTTLSLRV